MAEWYEACLGLPHNCQSVVVQILSDALPLFDVICKRAVIFVANCLNSCPDVVSYIANHGVYFSRLASVLGRNVFTALQYAGRSFPSRRCLSVRPSVCPSQREL